MPAFYTVTGADFAAILPETILALLGLLLILLDAFARPLRSTFPYVALVGVAIANVMGHYTTGAYFAGAIEVSDLTKFVEFLTLAGVSLAILGGETLLARDNKNQGEFYAFLLWAAAGVILMVKGGDFLVIFLGLEIMSISLYVLAAWYRELPASVEAGMKYFLVGAFASAILLFGVATLYGRLGTTSLSKIAGLVQANPAIGFDPLLAFGLVMIVAALGFKIALVPFHGWAPDVYQGMTTPAVAFLSTAPKAGAVVVLIHILAVTLPGALGVPWQPLLAILAGITILFGNVVALAQRDLKRMLAYSGIAQMGYVAIGIATFTQEAFEGVLVFLAGYLVTNIAAFLAIGALSNGEKESHPLSDLAGLGRSQPMAGGILALSMLSLAGMPPTIGFIGKFLVFRAAVDSGFVMLALVGVAGSIISVGFYLRVVYMLFMKDATREVNVAPDDIPSGAAYLLAAAGMLALGLFPSALIDFARSAASSISLL